MAASKKTVSFPLPLPPSNKRATVMQFVTYVLVHQYIYIYICMYIYMYIYNMIGEDIIAPRCLLYAVVLYSMQLCAICVLLCTCNAQYFCVGVLSK